MSRLRAMGVPFATAIALLLGLAVAACSSPAPGSLSGTPGPGATSSLVPPEDGSPQASGADASGGPPAGLTSPVRGLVLHVDLAGLGKVTGFRLLTPDGSQVAFKMGVQENAADFPAAHLSEHMAGGDPVLVYFRQSGSDLVVYRLEDGAAASGSPASTVPPGPAAPASSSAAS